MIQDSSELWKHLINYFKLKLSFNPIIKRPRSSNMAFSIPLLSFLSFRLPSCISTIHQLPFHWRNCWYGRSRMRSSLLKGIPVLIILQLSPILVMEYLPFIELHLHEGCWVVNELCYFMGSMFRGRGLKVLTSLINQISRIQLDYFNEERMVKEIVRGEGVEKTPL